jgi:phosphatidate phosphatase APP1
MIALGTPPVQLQPYFGYRSATRLVISARALRGRRADFQASGRRRAIRTMLEQFASREEAGVRVTLHVELPGRAPLVHEAVTDREGYAHFDLTLDPAWPLPAHPAWDSVELSWRNREGLQRIPGYLLAPGTDGRLAVISDIDDTIIETGITGGLRPLLRNWRRLLAQLPVDRTIVPGADVFYTALGGGLVARSCHQPGERIPATHRPFFYVSSSPWNLFSYLVAFTEAKGLPLGPLLLRDWGLSRATLGAASHGAHKTRSIEALLAMFPGLRFAMIGDDTQSDLPAFAEAVQRYRERVAGVFIRTTAREALSAEEQAAKGAITAAGVPLWMGESFAVADEFLNAMGFTPGGETEQIVRAVEKLPTKAEAVEVRLSTNEPAAQDRAGSSADHSGG